MKKNWKQLMTAALAFCAVTGLATGVVSAKEEITYTTWTEQEIGIAEQFMAEHPDVKVAARVLDGNTYEELLMPMILNGDAPDVFMVKPMQVQDLIKEGYIRPITDKPCATVQAEKSPSIHAALMSDGEVYGYAVSSVVGSGIVYYNKKYFEEKGFKEPETIEEFDALMKKIKELGDEPLIVPAADTWLAWYPAQNEYYAVLSDLGEYENAEVQKKILRGELKPSDIYRRVFERLKNYVESGYVSKTCLGMDWMSAAQYFVDGGAPLYVHMSALAMSDVVLNNTNENFELGAFPLPAVPDKKGICNVNNAANQVLVLSATSENPSAADALFDYLTQDQVLINWLNENGYYSANVPVEIPEVLRPVYEAWEDSAKYTAVMGNMPGLPTNWKLNFNQYCADVYSGADIEELLGKLDADCATALSNVDTDAYLSELE